MTILKKGMFRFKLFRGKYLYCAQKHLYLEGIRKSITEEVFSLSRSGYSTEVQRSFENLLWVSNALAQLSVD